MKQTKEDQLLAETYNRYVVKENVVKDALVGILDNMPENDRNDPNVVGSTLHSFMDQLEAEGPYNDYAAYGIKMALKAFNLDPGMIDSIVSDRAGIGRVPEEDAESNVRNWDYENDFEGDDGNVYNVKFNAVYGNIVDHDPGYPPSGIGSRDITEYGPVEISDSEVLKYDEQGNETPADPEIANFYLNKAWAKFLSNKNNWSTPGEY